MARWPKEQPSTWYSQYKRGSLVSAAGTARLACRTAWLGALHGLVAAGAQLLHST